MAGQGTVFARDHAAALRDAAPRAYRNLDTVMRAQSDLVKTITCLHPVLNDKREAAPHSINWQLAP